MLKLQHLQQFVKTATMRLALSYLAIIMLMSIGFSVVFYNVSAGELGRQGPPPAAFSDDSTVRGDGTLDDDTNSGRGGSGISRQELRDFLEQRAAEGRQSLLQRLIMLNLLALVAGSALSYYLARRTLRPIEENLEAQAQFVSDASHELRTPLTAMQTMNEVALRRAKLTPADAKDLASKNVEEVIKLRALTDGLLKLARSDGTDIVLSAVHVQDIATEAINRIVILAQAKHISVEDNIDNLQVRGDAGSLCQALVILLDNAIKYSPAGSTVFLSSEKKGKFGLLQVRDQGPGIRPYDLRKIFDRFYRADQSRSSQIVEGHGIGLSLAKKIMQQHGGDVTATSTVGKGTTFILKIPAI